MTSLVLTHIEKRFNQRIIFSDVNLSIDRGEVLGIVGKNGSGKSTLLKIMAGVLAPNKGTVSIRVDGKTIDGDHVHKHIGFCSPYLQMFDEFSSKENIQFVARARGMKLLAAQSGAWLQGVGLPADREDAIIGYSSGMKQRMKLLFATMHHPDILFLDEPITNLDQEGIDIVYSIVRQFKQRGIVVIATNQKSDLDVCDRLYDLEERK